MTPQLASGLGLLLALSVPASVRLLESALHTHLLVQMPLLVLVGILLARGLWSIPSTGHGGPGVAIAISVALYWMLPRSMDAALEHGPSDVAKFATLVACVGIPLGRSWPRLGVVTRGFLLANLLPMLWVLGWLYLSAPVRVCNYYLRDDQALTGQLLLGIGGVLALALTLRCFLHDSRPALHGRSRAARRLGQAARDLSTLDVEGHAPLR